ncbi:hypothetical protein llg_18780 [Luteolibacter sp. LG18]|nr:hypothetical protein llg_18780 [Luteolibacter sp. LG18]
MQASEGGSPHDEALARGIELARQRRLELSALMKSDPSAALAQVLSYSQLQALPAAVRAECEKPWSATGSIDLRWESSPREADHAHCDHQNIAYVGNDHWRIRGPEFMEPQLPRTNAPMQGYLIGDELLLEASAVHPVAGAELTAAKELFPVGNPSVDPVAGVQADPAIAAVVGGKLHYFASTASLQTIEDRLAQATRDAEATKTTALNHGMAFLEASSGSSGGSTPVEATPYLGNAINVLFIRVDFSDFPGEPVSKSALESTLSIVNGYVNSYSYGQASVAYTVTPTYYRMPATGASYATAGNNDGLMSAAKTLATNAGYNLANYSVVAVYFPSLSGVANSQITYGGLASVGGGNHWINGANDASTITHEFGHNYGLFHANYWDPDHDFSGIADYNDPAGNSYEYGDLTDTMGYEANGANGYFNPFETRRLEWMPSNKVVEPTGTGTWRISRFDDPSALSNQTLALRVPMGGSRYYWVGLRKRYTTPTNFLNAAYVVAEGLYAGRSNLIDMTPNSSGSATNDRRDAGLIVGASYYDSSAGVKFETLASGGTAPNEWIDVKVTFDPRISIVDTTPEVDEKAGTALVTVRRSYGATAAASVGFATANGTATAGTDYYTASGTLTWAAGDNTDRVIRVPIRPDASNEGRETFTVQLSGATGATLDGAASTATVTIVDAGKQLLKFAPGFFNLKATTNAPLPDGKVLIGGLISPASGEYQDVHNFTRLNADGSVDTSFLTGSGFDAEVLKIVVQPDGKILVGGLFTTYNGVTANRLVRLNSNGTLDTAFMTAMGAGPSGGVNVRALAVESTGAILVGGDFSSFSGTSTEGLIRLTSTGAPDTATPLTLPFATSWNSAVYDLIAQDDGKIMVAGSFYIGPGAPYRPGVARLNANGSRDTTFDPGAGPYGATVTTLGTVTCIARQSDGKYVLGGIFSNYDGHPVSNLVRTNANGTWDSSFSGPTFNSTPQDVVAQGSGGIVVGGWFTSPANYLIRLTSTGATDSSFLSGTGPGGSVYSVVEGPDGALFVGGNFFTYDGVTSRPIVKVAGGTSPYQLWAISSFTAAQFTAGLTDPEDDTDGDGVRNGTEFALGTNPRVGGTVAAGTTTLATSGPNRYLQLSLDRSASVGGLWAVAQFSSDLVTWAPAAPVPGSNATYDVIEDTGAKFTVRDKTAVSSSAKRFGRIVFKMPQ